MGGPTFLVPRSAGVFVPGAPQVSAGVIGTLQPSFVAGDTHESLAPMDSQLTWNPDWMESHPLTPVPRCPELYHRQAAQSAESLEMPSPAPTQMASPLSYQNDGPTGLTPGIKGLEIAASELADPQQEKHTGAPPEIPQEPAAPASPNKAIPVQPPAPTKIPEVVNPRGKGTGDQGSGKGEKDGKGEVALEGTCYNDGSYWKSHG